MDLALGGSLLRAPLFKAVPDLFWMHGVRADGPRHWQL
jgi:hypothetical protein